MSRTGKNYLEILLQASKKQHRKIIGLMSGTSLDGLDIALCDISGCGYTTQVQLQGFKTYPYSIDEQQLILDVSRQDEVSLQNLTIMHAWLGRLFAEKVNLFLQDHNLHAADVDAIASHGQTVYHAPYSKHKNLGMPNATLQIGDADHIAVNTGIITISDFRQKNIASGGEGAPLAGLGDEILFGSDPAKRILLNIGGIANITYLQPGQKPICSDVGPGNILCDILAKNIDPAQLYDSAGAMAAKGNCQDDLLNAFFEDPFMKLPLPKSTGTEYFNKDWLAKFDTGIYDKYDVLATATKFTAVIIAKQILNITKHEPCTIYVSGGGMHNTTMMDNLRLELPGYKLTDTGSLGLNPDAKEAVLFALLANETIMQSRVNNTLCLGKISLPA